MSYPLISIIIPIYNVEKYITQCLDTVIAQTYENIEILCIYDENTTDFTLQKLQQFQDKRISIITTNVLNSGASRNIGIEKAKGEYILFVDPDDWVDPQYVQLLYDNMISGDHDLVVCKILSYDDQTALLYKDPYYNYSWLTRDTYTKEELFNNSIQQDVSASNKLYKISIIRENNIKFIENVIFEDNIFYYHYVLCCTNSLKYIDNLFYFYRINRTDSRSTKSKSYIDMFIVVQSLQQLFQKYSPQHVDFILKRGFGSILFWATRGETVLPQWDYCVKMCEWIKENEAVIHNQKIVCRAKHPLTLYKYLYKKVAINPYRRLLKQFTLGKLFKSILYSPIIILKYIRISLKFI